VREAGHEPVPSGPELAPKFAAELPAALVIASLTSAAYEQAPLYRALKADPRTKDLPLLLCTGRGEYTVKRRLGERPPHVLFKPYTMDQLTAAVKELLP
jgi:hypothetical protein